MYLTGHVKNLELSKLQMNIQEVAKSFIKYTTSEEQTFVKNSLSIKIKRFSNLTQGEVFENKNGDEIIVTPKSSAKSVGFYGFSNLDCIMENRYDW